MSITEISLLAIALGTLTCGAVAIIVARRMLPVLRRSERTLRRSRRTLRRLGRMTRDLEVMTRDARVLEGRVARSAHGVLDQVEPLTAVLRGLAVGTRAGLGSLFSTNGHGPRRGRRRRFDRERSYS